MLSPHQAQQHSHQLRSPEATTQVKTVRWLAADQDCNGCWVSEAEDNAHLHDVKVPFMRRLEQGSLAVDVHGINVCPVFQQNLERY